MELDQKLGMSLDQLMKSDADTKKALRSSRLRGRRPRAPRSAPAKMDTSDDKPARKPSLTSKKAVAKKTTKTAIVKKAIIKKSTTSNDVEMRSDSKRRRPRKSSEDGIEKIEKSSASSRRVILTSKKEALSAAKKSAEHSQSTDRRTIKVTNIPYEVHWRDVKDAFARLVPVERCDVDKGVATVVFKSRSDAQRAIDTYNGGNMNGRVIKASFAQ
jgi:RNA recognition motif-containing protein